MENFKINIIDGIMGCGKSTAMINYIKTQKQKYPTSKFLIIVPYLDEVTRYANNLREFCKLLKDVPPKRITLEKYLKEGKDIICTHQLFLQNPDLIVKYAKDYNLIIDEALNSLISTSEFPQFIDCNKINTTIEINANKKLSLKKNAQTCTFTEADINFLLNTGYLKYNSPNDNLIIWNKDTIEINSIYNCLKDYFTFNDVYRLEAKHELENNGYYYISLFPVAVFKSFKSIYVITYLWNAQIMKYYFDFHNAEYKYFYPVKALKLQTQNNPAVKKEDYFLVESHHLYENVESIIKHKTMHNIFIPGYKIQKEQIIKDTKSRTSLYSFWNTNKHDKKITLSYSYYTSLNENKDNTIITVLQNNIKKFCKDNIPKDLRKNKNIIWSVFDCSKDSIKKNCTYIDDKNYVPINTKATNAYKDANVLIYLVNRFINPHLYNFIKNYCPTGDNFSEDLYSLSELIQWIWRSAIRDNKQICIYIASERMLNILLKWLNASNNDTHITPTLNYGSSKNLSNNNKATTNPLPIANSDNNTITNIQTNSKGFAYQAHENKYKFKCIDTIMDFLFIDNNTIDKTTQLIEEYLETSHEEYSYEVIFNTIILEKPSFILAKSNLKEQSNVDLLSALFEIINKKAKNTKQYIDKVNNDILNKY